MLLNLLKRLLSYFLPPIVFIILNKLKFGKKQNTPSLNKLYDPTFQPWRFSSKKLKIDNLSGSEKKDLFEFERIREEIQKFSLVSFDRLWILYKLSQHSKALNGDFVECGVYKGGTAFLFKDIVQNNKKKKKKKKKFFYLIHFQECQILILK